jgi:hypothetical protein
LAKPNYQFEKRQKEMAKKNKKEEKRRQKAAGNNAADDGNPENPVHAAEPEPSSNAVLQLKPDL